MKYIKHCHIIWHFSSDTGLRHSLHMVSTVRLTDRNPVGLPTPDSVTRGWGEVGGNDIQSTVLTQFRQHIVISYSIKAYLFT